MGTQTHTGAMYCSMMNHTISLTFNVMKEDKEDLLPRTGKFSAGGHLRLFSRVQINRYDTSLFSLSIRLIRGCGTTNLVPETCTE